MKWLSVFLLVCIMISSCEKDVNFDLQEESGRMVVDARIEEGQPPFVVLTKSVGYFNTFSPQLLSSMFVHGAIVTVSNGSQTDTLTEMMIELSPGVTVSYYTLDSASLATGIIGELNHTYTLNVVNEGKAYTATTHILDHYATLDSMWTKSVPDYGDTLARQLMVRITDPPGMGNYLRYFTKVNSGPYLPGMNSVADDQVIDGSSFNFQIEQGIDKNNIPDLDSIYFEKGDTITLKFCNIDQASYIFWSTWEFAFQSNGNPFSQPNKVIGNVSNGALGVFSGYACRFRTIVAQ